MITDVNNSVQISERGSKMWLFETKKRGYRCTPHLEMRLKCLYEYMVQTTVVHAINSFWLSCRFPFSRFVNPSDVPFRPSRGFVLLLRSVRNIVSSFCRFVRCTVASFGPLRPLYRFVLCAVSCFVSFCALCRFLRSVVSFCFPVCGGVLAAGPVRASGRRCYSWRFLHPLPQGRQRVCGAVPYHTRR